MKKPANSSPADLRAQLHDGACQTLTAVHLHASVLAKKLQRICPDAAGDMQELDRLINQARTELYQIIKP